MNDKEIKYKGIMILGKSGKYYAFSELTGLVLKSQILNKKWKTLKALKAKIDWYFMK